MRLINIVAIACLTALASSCKTEQKEQKNPAETQESIAESIPREPDTALISHLFTADPSAHVFGDRLYVYPSHDFEAGIPADDLGSHFGMKDYHVFSMDRVGGPVTDHGKVLDVADVPWAERQMWAPDAAEKDGRYYFYFPAKDPEGVFRIGVATADSPEGPFVAEPEPIQGAYSIDPAVFRDGDDAYYLYFGGIWGGQLQRWESGAYVAEDSYPADSAAAISPKMARLSEDMMGLAEPVRDIQILDENGTPIRGGDHDRWFFEAAWVHRYQDTYYLSYSTGDTHNIAYATADSPYGPFTYRGVILKPVLGWTNHHSIVEYQGNWYLFYHDSSLSGGQTHLRSVKVTPLTHREDGSIRTLDKLVVVEEAE